MAAFEVDIERREGMLVARPRGEIDLATVDLVREAVEREHQPGDAIVLDLRPTEFMDTSGLRYVVELNDRAAAEGFALHLVRGPTAVQRVFEVAGLDARLPFVDDAPEA